LLLPEIVGKINSKNHHRLQHFVSKSIEKVRQFTHQLKDFIGMHDFTIEKCMGWDDFTTPIENRMGVHNFTTTIKNHIEGTRLPYKN